MKLIDHGLDLLEQGSFSRAKDVFLDLLDEAPGDPRVNFGLGVVFSHYNENRRALAHLTAASKAAKKLAIVHMKLAEVLMDDLQFDEALIAARKGVSLAPKLSAAHLILGLSYHRLQRPVMAKASFETALRLDPNNIDAYLELANHEATLGQFENALEFLDAARNAGLSSPKAVELELEYYGARSPASITDDAKAILDNDRTSADKNKVSLSFKYAKYLEGKDLRLSFDYYQRYRSCLYRDYDVDLRRNQVEVYRQVFTPEFFSSRLSASFTTEKPVFVVGMPRSGTTLSEQIIGRHKRGAGIGECSYFQVLQGDLFNGEQFSGQFIDIISSMRDEKVKKLGRKYLKILEVADKKALRVVDKMPHNFEMLWLIALLFPNAKIIHMRRNPADTCSSIFTTALGSGHSYNIDQRTLGRYYKLYEEMMAHWKSVLPVQIYELEYEKLVMDQEAESRKLIEHIGLDWDPACLEFYKSDSQVLTASQSQVRQPIYRSSIGRWKKYEEHIQPLLEELGMA